MYAICFAEFDTSKKLYLGTSLGTFCSTENPEEAGPLFPTIIEAANFLKENNTEIENLFNEVSGDILGIITIKDVKEVK